MSIKQTTKASKRKIIFWVWLFLMGASFTIFLATILFKPIIAIEIINYTKGTSAEQTNLIEKISNDLNLKPSRHIVNYNNNESLNYRQLEDISLNPRRDEPEMFLSPNAPRGYRLIFGIFDFKEKLYGAILLDALGKVVNVWQISQSDFAHEHRPDTNVVPRGIEVFPDGSIIINYSSMGSSLIKYDYCGKVVWGLNGIFHHSIAKDNDNSVWVWGGYNGGPRKEQVFADLLNINSETGKLERKIKLDDVIKANPEIDILRLAQRDNFESSNFFGLPSDYWHPNDIDPLPENLADKYENFEAGDLLISLRNLNLVFVLDSDTLKIKWWRIGVTRRQHDPDWNDRGTITIYNNNMHREFSNIVEINPKTYEVTYPVDGQKYDFYSWQRGNVDIIQDNGFLITSSEQGRVFELNSDGEVVFEFLNTFNKAKNEYLVISESRFLALDFFTDLKECE